MTITLNHTHDAQATSWLASANGHADFPIQNLPIAEFRRTSSAEPFRGGVAVGDQVLDLAALCAIDALPPGAALDACKAASKSALNDFLALGPGAWRALRHGLFALLETKATAAQQKAVRACLVPMGS